MADQPTTQSLIEALRDRADHVKQQLGAGLAGWDVPQLIEDHQILPGQLRAERQQLLVVPAFVAPDFESAARFS